MCGRIGRALIVAGAVLLAFSIGPRAQTPDAMPPDVLFGRSIAIIRAHVGTGDELVQRRDWNVAHRHFMFPLEEVYGVIRGNLRTYKTPPFDGALKSLARIVKAHNARQYPKALQAVESALGAADASLEARQANQPAFVVQVAVAILQAAPDEYDDAVVDGRIARPISYQVARGYALQAERMIERAAPVLTELNSDAFTEIRENFAQLKQAFASVNAPKQPVLDVAAVSDRIDKIAAVAAGLRYPERAPH
jgi:hypothetical protein